jgi:hypothetical protein
MTIDPITAYSSQSLGSDAQWNRESSRQMLSAKVSTRTVGVQLGKLGVSLSTQKVSFAEDQEAPAILKDFAREMELQYLTQHVEPFKPAGSYALNATTRRMGLDAYVQQASFRNVAPMINVMV